MAHETFKPISHFAINALARLAARRAVVEQLRGQGVRVTLLKPATISAKANEYLAQHPELYAQAHATAELFKMGDRIKRRQTTC
jgi:hypothetical protein